MTTSLFLQQMKNKAEAKAKQMAALELSVWDNNHENELKQHFGFTDAKLIQRKKQLKKAANAK